METKRKTFDCVEMKDRIQRELMKEFEARRREFKTYADFINATAGEDPTVRAWRLKMKSARGGVGHGA
jgi:hypothetical protein